jgi:regulator of CtrA degradation
MMSQPHHSPLTARLIDALYTEAMLLADEVRAYFDGPGRGERDLLPPVERVGFACESLRVTTRLMHVIAWLLTRRSIESGELTIAQAGEQNRRLGHAAPSDPALVAPLPEQARALIAASADLYARVRRLDQDSGAGADSGASPVQGLMSRLERAF